MKRGRVPKPTVVKKLIGSYQPCRDPARGQVPSAPALPAGCPPCPDDFDARAARIWGEVAPELTRIGTLAGTDLSVLRLYCETAACVEQFREIARVQPMVETKTGVRVNPAAAEARKQAVIADRLSTALGLNYASRARTGAPQTPQDAAAKERREAVDKFLFERQPFSVIDGGKKE